MGSPETTSSQFLKDPFAAALDPTFLFDASAQVKMIHEASVAVFQNLSRAASGAKILLMLFSAVDDAVTTSPKTPQEIKDAFGAIIEAQDKINAIDDLLRASAVADQAGVTV